jgi:hypothetical protein
MIYRHIDVDSVCPKWGGAESLRPNAQGTLLLHHSLWLVTPLVSGRSRICLVVITHVLSP